MKPISRIPLLLVTLLVMVTVFTGSVSAQTPDTGEGKFVFGGSYTLRSDETLYGGLVIVGGSAELEEDSLVVGDIVVVGGSLDVYGEVEGSLIAIGGSTYLGEKAIIDQDLVTIGGSVQRDEDAVIRGSITAEMPEDFDIEAFSPESLNTQRTWQSVFLRGFRSIGDIMINFMQTLAMAALAAVMALFLLKPMQRISKAVTAQPLVTGGLGILTIIVLPALLVVLAITLVLIPLSLIGIIALGAAFIFGWISLGLEIGLRLERMFKLEEPWAPAVRAGIGTFALSLVSLAVGLVPCIGWILPFLVAMLGLGGVVITLFGSRQYPEAPSAKPVVKAKASEADEAPAGQKSGGLDALLADAAEDAEGVNNVDDDPQIPE